MLNSIAKKIKFSADSQKGARYEENEDALLALPELNIFAVADGMGGHSGGAVASNTTVNHITNALCELNEKPSAQWMLQTLRGANQEVYELSKSREELHGMGCTLSMAYVDQDKLVCFHIGDSRIYRLHNFQLEQLSTDHTADSKDLGKRKIVHQGQRGITRAIGVKASPQFDTYTIEHQEEAEYLLVTDGITDVLADYEITNILTDMAQSYSSRLKQLSDMALSKGSTDDRTSIFFSLQKQA